jgi:glyceraldehyde 3-phosphate dehydrogenase
MTTRVGINGFGRIGRMVFRAALHNPEVEVVAVNDLTDAQTLAHLLQYDSVHGTLKSSVTADENKLIVGERSVFVSSERDPAKLPWRELEVDVVAECTGLFRDHFSAARHLEAGARKVIISAPAKDPDLTVVGGVNDHLYEPSNHHILSNASCTTNCLAPIAQVLHDNFGVQSGLMTTIHSYTSDQRLMDLPHKDLRRARSAGLSLIPTSTGAAQAVALVLPELAGKLNGLAIRVPTPNVSLVDFVANLNVAASGSEVNNALEEAASGRLAGILGFNTTPLVSSDFNGNQLSSIVDALSTQVVERTVKVLAWYDNETGYSHRMVDLIAMVGKHLDS